MDPKDAQAPAADAGHDNAQQPLHAGSGATGEAQQQAQTGAGAAAAAKGTPHLQRVDAKGAPSRMRVKEGETDPATDQGGYGRHGRPRSPEERLKGPYSEYRS